MTTGRDLITKSMQKIGVLTMTETMTADMANDGLFSLNAMLSGWSNMANLINARVSETFSLVAGTSSYTIGTGQTFNTTRPMFINDATVRADSIDYQITAITDEDYLNIPDKTTRRDRPQLFNYTNGYAAGTINFYPTPDKVYTVTILSEKPLSSVTLDADVSFPPGWEEAIVYNLPIRLAPEYGQPVTAELVQMAKQSLHNIKTAIMRNRTMDCDPPRFLPDFQNGYYY